MAEARVEELNELVTSLKEELARSRDSDIQQQEVGILVTFFVK